MRETRRDLMMDLQCDVVKRFGTNPVPPKHSRTQDAIAAVPPGDLKPKQTNKSLKYKNIAKKQRGLSTRIHL
jgi:hypothetical protein